MIATRSIAVALAVLFSIIAAAAAPDWARAQEEGDGEEPTPAAAEQPEGGAEEDEGRVAVISYVIVDGVSAPEPLTSTPGDPERGRAIYFDADLGNCASCHWVPDVEGDRDALPGPRLDDVGVRYSRGVVRLWIINPRALTDQSTMPAYYSLTPMGERIPNDAPERLDPLLTAQEIEDLVAYLDSLSAPVTPIGNEN